MPVGIGNRPWEGKTTCCVGCIPLIVGGLLLPVAAVWFSRGIIRAMTGAYHFSISLIVVVLVVAFLAAVLSSRRK